VSVSGQTEELCQVAPTACALTFQETLDPERSVWTNFFFLGGGGGGDAIRTAVLRAAGRSDESWFQSFGRGHEPEGNSLPTSVAGILRCLVFHEFFISGYGVKIYRACLATAMRKS